MSARLDRHLPGLNTFVLLNTGPMFVAMESRADLFQPTCREIIILIGIVGLSCPEVTAHLGITEDHARKLHLRATVRAVRLLTPR